jgi:hypothetical protein
MLRLSYSGASRDATLTRNTGTLGNLRLDSHTCDLARSSLPATYIRRFLAHSFAPSSFSSPPHSVSLLLPLFNCNQIAQSDEVSHTSQDVL